MFACCEGDGAAGYFFGDGVGSRGPVHGAELGVVDGGYSLIFVDQVRVGMDGSAALAAQDQLHVQALRELLF